VSSFVCFHLVALPALRKMAGWASPGLRRVHVRLANSIKMDPERPEYHRAMLQYGRRVRLCSCSPARVRVCVCVCVCEPMCVSVCVCVFACMCVHICSEMCCMLCVWLGG